MQEQIIYKKISELKNNPNNPRKNDTAVDTVAKSIEKYGFRNPLIIDDANIVWCGNTRLKAAKKLKLKEVPCIVVNDLTEQQMTELALLDNKTNEIAERDDNILAGILPNVDLSDFDLDWGLYNFDIETEKAEEDDYVEPDNLEIRVHKGEVWQLGRHRLMCGDSTKEEDVAKLMNGNKADMVFTDPPYGYEYQSNMRTKSKKFDVLKNDDKILDFMPVIKELCNGFVFVCTTWKVLDKWLPLFNKYYDLSNMIIWDKGGGGIGDLKHTFSTDYEIILCSNNGMEITGKRIGSVWNIPKDNANDYVHATQKPIKLISTAIENTTKINDIVVDIFGGSGSTLIACEQLNRNCYMMELDEHYATVIIDRWEKLTGQKAEKIN